MGKRLTSDGLADSSGSGAEGEGKGSDDGGETHFGELVL